MVYGVYVLLMIHAIVGFLQVEITVISLDNVLMHLKVDITSDYFYLLTCFFSVFQAGINAWQALEIIFLFLTTSALLIALAAVVCYRIRHSLHYYLAILAVFCVWPAGKKNCFDNKTKFLLYLSMYWHFGIICLWFCCI
jgi:hypothetical protein